MKKYFLIPLLFQAIVLLVVGLLMALERFLPKEILSGNVCLIVFGFTHLAISFLVSRRSNLKYPYVFLALPWAIILLVFYRLLYPAGLQGQMFVAVVILPPATTVAGALLGTIKERNVSTRQVQHTP